MTFQTLQACIDSAPHTFAVSVLAPGNFGHAQTYCTRCGKFRSELDATIRTAI